MNNNAQLIELDNGLTIIIKEDHSAPVASVQAWAQTGSINEGQWLGAGLSHVLEHNLFKGTSTRPGSRIDQEVQAAGGQMNAATSFNYTFYYIDIPSSGVRVAIDVLCDIMQNATLPADELEKERQVILREMDMGQDDPDRRASRRLFETAYHTSPYRCPIIGYKDVFNAFTRDDLMAYYKKMYVPNNIFLVIVGDINPADIESQIRECFANAKRGVTLAETLPAEKPQLSEKIIEEYGPVELIRAHIAWHIPHALHPDLPALSFIANLLGTGKSSRLWQKLHEESGLVQNIDSWIYDTQAQGLFGISAEIELAKYQDALNAIQQQIDLLRTQPITNTELRRIKKQYLVSRYEARKTMTGQALELGADWLTAHDLDFSQKAIEAIQKLTPQDILSIAQTWFRSENRIQYSLLPETAKTSKQKKTTSTQLETPAGTPQLIQNSELHGLRLIHKKDNRLPLVYINVAIKGGLLAETAETNGVMNLMSTLLIKGTKNRTAAQINEAIENVGGKITSYSSHSTFGISLQVLNEDFDLAMDILTDCLLNPIFDEKIFEMERQIAILDVQSEPEQMLQYSLSRMKRELFGKQSFGLNAAGSLESLKKIKRQDLITAWRTWTLPQNAVLAIFGDISAEQATDASQKLAVNWAKQTIGVTQQNYLVTRQNWVQKARQIEEIQKDKKQSVIIIGYPSITCFDKNTFSLTILQEICSDLGSRLFLRIRDELALAYYIGAFQQFGITPGFFCFYVGTHPDATEQVITELQAQAKLLREQGVTQEELNRAKAKLLGARTIGRQEIGEIAKAAARAEIIGLGYDYLEKEIPQIQAVTCQDIQQITHQILNPDRCVISIVRG